MITSPWCREKVMVYYYDMTTPPWCREKVMVYYYYYYLSKELITTLNSCVVAKLLQSNT